MENVSLHIEKRQEVGGGGARRLRENGYIPAVVYGRGSGSTAVQVKASDIKEFISRHGRNTIFSTEFAAEQDFHALIKDIQYDPVRQDIVHLDFQKVSLDEKVHTEVPIRVIGRERVEKEGHVVVHQLNTVRIECLPQDVPQHIDANVSDMKPGQALTASKLKLPIGVILVSKPTDVILSVTGGELDLKVDKKDEAVVPVGEEGNVHAKKV